MNSIRYRNHLIAESEVITIQLTILLLLWGLSKDVQKCKEKPLVTLIILITYGIGTYLYVIFAFRGY